MMFNNKDGMCKTALVRIVLLRHSGEEKWRGIQLTQIIGIDTFEFGHICSDNDRNMRDHSWIREDIDMSCRDQVDELFKDKPIGFYEVLATHYHESWHDSYNGEYDSNSELRDVSIASTTYDQASCFDQQDFLSDSEQPLVGEKSETGYYPFDHGLISPYMPKIRILKRQAQQLELLVNEWSNSRPDFSKMTEDELASVSFMMGLEIESIAAKQGDFGVIMRAKMIQINRVTEEVLADHKLWMEHE